MNPLAQALAAALLHFLWEGSAIALALAIAMRVTRASPTSGAERRYALACFAMLAMLAGFAATFGIVWFSANGASTHTVVGAAAAHRAPPVPLRFDPLPPSAEQRLPWIVPVWLLGVCALALRSLLSAAGARRLRIIGVCPAPEAWQRKLGELAARARISAPVALLESCLAEVPVVVGWLRPAILIPAGLLAGFPAEQIELILIHELAHIRRHDYLVNLLQCAVEDLLFYHPAVWWVSSQIRMERENCCDDAVRECGDARTFAAALLAMEQSRWSAQEMVLSAKGGHLMNRIKRLLEVRENPRTGFAPVLLAAMLAASVAVSVTAGQSPAVAIPPVPGQPAAARHPETRPPVLLAQARPAPTPAQAATELKEPFKTWLDHDVAYIIADDERAAFERLQTDEERAKFIEQFWARRDPTPGTPANEFQEENSRRLAYANDRFASQGMQGWQSDRGRIYVMFGPPDEIDDHTGATAAAQPPYVTWTYRYVDSVGSNVSFTFVDDGAGLHIATLKGLPANTPNADALRKFPYLQKLRNQLDPVQLNQTQPDPKVYKGRNKTFYFFSFEKSRTFRSPESTSG